MTISRKYRSYGVRRLNNLSDIDNPEQALNNLLNNLQERPGESFISQDLDVIRGIKDTEVFPSTFIQLSPSAPTYTFANTLGPQEDYVRPFVTLQDRINTYRSVTGAAGKQGSGYGPEGWFVPSTSFKASPVKGDTVSTIIPSYTTNKAGLVEADDFWTLGEFYIDNSFHPTFSNGKGGVIWEAFYIPDYTTAQGYIDFYTTGLFHFEMDRFNTGDWKVYKSIYAVERSVTISANNNTSTTVNLITGDDRYLAVGDKLTTNNEITITDVSPGLVTLSNPITAVKDQSISFEFDIGKDVITDRFSLDSAFDIGERAKIRLVWWYPNSMGEPEDRYLSIRRNEYVMLFSNFSNTVSYTTGDYELSKLLDRAVTGTQPSFGDRGSYKTFRVDDVLRSTYTPPLNYAAINKFGANTAITGTFSQGLNILTGNSSRMAQTAVGNVITASTPSFSIVGKNTRIKRIPSDNIFTDTRILTNTINSSANVSIRAIDHNGLVDYFIGSSSGANVTVNDTSKLKPGMICITYFTGSQYYRIQNVINSTSFSTATPLGLSSNNYIFVYSDSGLIDSSKDVFCSGVIGKVLTAPATAGSNTITVAANTDLTLGMRVQYTGGIEPADNYTITNITGTQVRLSKSVTLGIDVGATIVFAPSSSTGDKQQCVIPLDLSPPFTGKDYGLDTNGKRITSMPGANLDITVMSLSSNTSTVTSANTTDVFSSFIRINGIYKIKARTIT